MLLAAQLVLAQPVALTLAWADAPQEPTQTVVVFPTANEAGATFELPAMLTSGLADVAARWPGTQMMMFNPRNPSVQRAIKEQRLRDSDITGSIDFDKAVRIGKEMGADYVLVSAVEEAKYDKDAGTYSLVAIAQLGDSANAKLIKGTNATGSASGAALSESQLAMAAIKDAVSKLANGLAIESRQIPQPAKLGGKKKGQKWVYAVLAGALIFALASGSSGDSGGDNPPPPPQ